MNGELTFEQALQRLEEIVRLLESGDLTLAEGMALYKEGALLARFSRQKLEEAKVEVEVWQKTDSADGNQE